MAYNFYQPNYLQNYNQQSNIYWVQGIEGAKAYPVGAGNSILLMDSDNQVMYIKTADQSGVPSLRIFDYNERTAEKTNTVDLSAYVTRKEFDELLVKISNSDKKKKKKRDEYEEDDE